MQMVSICEEDRLPRKIFNLNILKGLKHYAILSKQMWEKVWKKIIRFIGCNEISYVGSYMQVNHELI